ncbi:MAG: HlyD family efflux transporter periplasmic adaptor subunit [Bryobacteraceae bacterium]
MDVQRTDARRRKWTRRILVAGTLLITVPAITIGLARLKPAAPLVEASSVWPGEVKRGQMVRQVRGLGTLVAEDVLLVPAVTDGRVEKILVRPGAALSPETVLVILTNPELEQQTLDAEYQVKMAEAQYRDLRVQLESQTLTQKAELARIESEATLAKLRLDRDEQRFKEGLVVALDYKITKSTAEESARRASIERERLKIRQDSVEAQLAVQRAQIDKYKAMYDLRKSQIAALQVRSAVNGVLQDLPGAAPNTQLQIGQRVTAGTILAKVAEPTKLKAELKVPETQVNEVRIGQRAEIDTRNGIINGRVSRIDPAAKEGTVLVDVHLESALPPGARPDLSVDGVIEIEKLENVLFVGRPAFGQPNSMVSMFRYVPDGKEAARVQVKFGRTSVNTIEILEGLAPGDKVILSDMSQWDAYDRVRLN